MGRWSVCVSCEGSGGPICATCAAQLVPARQIPPIVGVESVRAMFDYCGVGRGVIAAVKFRNRRAAMASLARALAVLMPPGATLISWIPTSDQRRRARGFDQAEVLARKLSRESGVPCRSTMSREPGPAQTGADREQRLTGPRFTVVGNVVNQRVVLVDDVITTGSTIRSAAATLHIGGVDAVHAIGLAFTSPGM